MTRFRPCIDLHAGQVKQIVGGSLRDDGSAPTTNFVADLSAGHFARMYRDDALAGGHVIMLGPGNDEAALEALAAYPGGLQVGGGIRADNAQRWLDAGADKVIVTSWLFDSDRLDVSRAEELAKTIGADRLVIDLSCRRVPEGGWCVATNRWQTVTKTAVTAETLRQLSSYCSEYLVHAADVEGKCEGVDGDLVRLLGDHSPLPCTYAGGARTLDDLAEVRRLSAGRVDLTIGSALDLFGGDGVRYLDCVAWNRQTP